MKTLSKKQRATLKRGREKLRKMRRAVRSHASSASSKRAEELKSAWETIQRYAKRKKRTRKSAIA